jgi:hypothetical protein
MFMKFFLHHKVKWDDSPITPGSPLESARENKICSTGRLETAHIEADGKKTWQDTRVVGAQGDEMKDLIKPADISRDSAGLCRIDPGDLAPHAAAFTRISTRLF